jgi:alpha-glucuronidase
MQNWSQLWLRYQPVENQQALPFLQSVSCQGFDISKPIMQNAYNELARGLKGLLNLDIKRSDKPDGTLHIEPIKTPIKTPSGSYFIKESQGRLTLSAYDESGVLYGIFEILR